MRIVKNGHKHDTAMHTVTLSAVVIIERWSLEDHS